MTERNPSGPSGVAQWQTLRTGAVHQWPPLSVSMLPDASDGGFHAILHTPALWRESSEGPAFSLTLVLERSPLPTETNITPLVISGYVAFEVTAAVPVPVRESLATSGGYNVRPIFAREGWIRLTSVRNGTRTTLDSTTLTGTSLRAALSAALYRDEALEILSALDGQASFNMRLASEIAFRTSTADAEIIISGYWAEVFDFLQSRVDARNELTRAVLENAFGEMLHSGIIAATASGPHGTSAVVPLDSPSLLTGFLRIAGLVLSRTASDTFRLRQRPHPVMRFEYKDTSPSHSMRTANHDSALDTILGGALDAYDRNRFIHLVCPGAGSNGSYTAAPRKMTLRSSRGLESPRTQLTAMDGPIKSIALAMRPSVAAHSAGSLVTSDLALQQVSEVPALHASKYWLVDDLILDRLDDGDKVRGLPVVDNPSAPIWRDRIDGKRYWFAPAFTVIRPGPNVDPGTSPFLFTYRRVGATADGKPALTGSVRITLHADLSDVQRRALAAMPGTNPLPVPLQRLSIVLSVPYIDTRDGQLHRTSYQAKASQNGNTITATFDLINDSVRLAYGALAVPGFQREPARLEITYAYEAYVPLEVRKVDVVAGGKIAITPIAQTKLESSKLLGRPHLNVAEASLDYGPGEIRLRREPPRSREGPEAPVDDTRQFRGPGMMVASTAVLNATAAVLPATVAPAAATIATAVGPAGVATQVATVQPAVGLARPEIAASAGLVELIRRVQYATRTLVRQESVDTLFPCEQLGSLYRQENDAGTEAIGCVDALRLGQTVVRQYAEMPALTKPEYRVFRSLGQPGRFLVLPAAYHITRYSPSVTGKAYRPAVAVYSSIDATNAENNRVIYHATLQPGIPPHMRRELLDRLRAEAHDPVIEYPTELTAEVEYAWTVGSTIHVEPKVVKAPDSFQVTLATDLAGALLLKTMVQTTGVFGCARFKIPDGTVFETNLVFALNTITGPWATGPVEITVSSARATVRNAIERPIDVSELIVYAAAGPPQRIPVEVTLAPNATRAVPVPTTVTETYAVCTVGGTADDIVETRSFVEDIHTNVVFINLINFGNHDLAQVKIESQIKGVPGVREVPMSGDPPHGSLDFLLPLTTYLASRVLQFRVTKAFNSAPSQTTPWLEWDLEANGNVVSLTWELIR